MDCYRNWAAAYTSSNLALSRLLCALPYCTVRQRKAVLTFSRVRPTLIEGSRFHAELATELKSFVDFTYNFGQGVVWTKQTCMVKRLLSDLPERYSLVMYSIISAASRMAPFVDYSSVAQVAESTVKKEIDAAISPSTNADLDFRCIFGPLPGDRFYRMYPNLPFDPQVNTILHEAFQKSKKLLDGKLFFPRFSDKTIGTEARRTGTQQAESLGFKAEYRNIETTIDVERVYHVTGVELEGVVEMRKAWKYNDLKPRVYYAQGPTVYKHSKFIQPIFNVIVDCFDVVHRHNRYSLPNDCLLDPQDILIIYDYTSFTSKLRVIKKFTRAMAEFYAGTSVVLVDSFRGPIVRDLGELLIEYTQTCNEFSLFDISRVLGLDTEHLLLHECGMLGVPGNISSCTLLHGIHLDVLLRSTIRGRCVGDDALGKVVNGARKRKREEFTSGVRNLGEIEDSKFSIWEVGADEEMDGWHYIKNPIARADQRITQGISLILPSIAIILGLEDEYHTESCPSLIDRQKIFIAQWTRYLDRFRFLHTSITDFDADLLVRFQNLAYRKLQLEKGGYVQVAKHPVSRRLLCPVRMHGDQFLRDWRFTTLPFLRNEDAIITVPLYRDYDDLWYGLEGERFSSRNDGLLGLLHKLGYLKKEMMTEEIRVNDLDDNLAMFYMARKYTFSYNFQFRFDAPFWIQDVQYALLMSPQERISNIPHM